MTRPLDIVIFGLSITSSWGNGHATTFRALSRGLDALGHRVTFIERDQPWYCDHRDMPVPPFCETVLYEDTAEVLEAQARRLAVADAVIVGSYVHDAVALIDRLAPLCGERLHFYDIDTPVTLDHLARGDAPYLARRQLPLFETVFSFSGGPALQLLEQRFGARRALPLYCSVDPDLYPLLDRPARWDLGYLGTHSDDRLPGLEALLLEPARRRPDLRFVVAGPQYPPDIDWPANVERIDHLPPARHPEFYASQRFTLNVTRAPMRRLGHSPSVRLFEASACGVPVISDHWDGLTDLLPEGEAILVASTSQDVLDALDMDESSRRAVGRRAREVVLAGHTGTARAARFATDLTRVMQPTV